MLLESAYSIEATKKMVAQTPFEAWRLEVSGAGFRAWLEK
jgi:hypothetical protein